MTTKPILTFQTGMVYNCSYTFLFSRKCDDRPYILPYKGLKPFVEPLKNFTIYTYMV